MRYRALYEFVARNQDEISFQPGDTIMVNLNNFYLHFIYVSYTFTSYSCHIMMIICIVFFQVPVTQNGEPGWLAGEIRGHTGWFPESYVEPLDAPAESAVAVDAAASTARLE